ncbi:MAG: hypothetical protein LJE92_01455 [Gammaproteobacteria bacterium]|jgi:hypothetical protein|nr:hypothetical protein [Gammaproteobacteria bacterium]
MNRRYLINNSRLLKNLNTEINKDHLLSTIAQLGHKVHKIESISGRSLHTIKMRSEIANLEDHLNYSKNQVILRA